MQIIRGNGTVVVCTGEAGEGLPTATLLTSAQLSKLLDKPFSISDIHRYKFDVAERGEVDEVAFFIDGIEIPLKNSSVKFGDEMKRKIHFVNQRKTNTAQLL